MRTAMVYTLFASALTRRNVCGFPSRSGFNPDRVDLAQRACGIRRPFRPFAADSGVDANRVAEIVSERTRARRFRDFREADRLKVQLEGMHVQLKDLPGGETTWRLKPATSLSQGQPKDSDPGDSIMSIAKQCLVARGNALEGLGKRALKLLQEEETYFVEDETAALGWEREKDMHGRLHGRQYADAAFLFAVSGLAGPRELFLGLADGANRELKRFGHRSSCPPATILAMAERLAAASIDQDHDVFSTTQDLLRKHHGINYDPMGSGKSWGDASLHSTRPLLWLWRHGAKGRLPEVTHEGVVEEDDRGLESREKAWSDVIRISAELQRAFTDCSRPLVIDLACGFGTTILGLSCNNPMVRSNLGARDDDKEKGFILDLSGANFLGCDIDHRSLGYARGVCDRLSESGVLAKGRVALVEGDAEAVLEAVARVYRGPTAVVLVQFPTPYRLEALAGDERPAHPSGNSQLPSQEEFLFSPDLAQKAAALLQPTSGLLALQSNVQGTASPNMADSFTSTPPHSSFRCAMLRCCGAHGSCRKEPRARTG